MKKLLRQKVIEERKEMNLPQISQQICGNITRLPEYQKAIDIGIFYPLAIEVNLMFLVNDSSKNFYLPKIENDSINFFKYIGKNDLEKGKFGILEPKNDIKATNLDIVITPALMADKKGYRLGWGGGFYDKYLEQFKSLTLCVIPHKNLIEKLPREKYDIPCNMVVTEKEIIKNF